jgi:molybdate transport system substrate-binding protein
LQLIDRWGISGSMADHLIQAPPGVPVGTMLAQGEADLGFQQLSELLHVPGIEVVGPLPSEIQAVTVFTAGVTQTSSQPEQACALVAFLTSPDAEAAKRQQGMEPA